MEDDIKQLVFNLMCDLKKRDINPIARAKLINAYLENTGQSQRSLALEIGVPKSTLEDWIMWGKITQKEYDGLKSEGYEHTDIYKSLRDGTLSGMPKAIDVTLNNCISKLEIFKIRPPHSKETKFLIGQLRHILDVIERQVK